MENTDKFKQLTFEQRKIIEKSLKDGCLQKDIALALGVNKSTISREVSSRSRDGVYWADLAQFNYARKRKKYKKCVVTKNYMGINPLLVLKNLRRYNKAYV